MRRSTATETVSVEQARETGRSCTCFHLRRATRLVTQLYDRALRPVDLRATQFTLLNVLRMHGPVTIQSLAAALVVDRTTLTRNLRPLERDGWVESTPGRDRRVREVLLTPEGHGLLARARPLWQKAQEEMATLVGVRQAEELVALLAHTVRALE